MEILTPHLRCALTLEEYNQGYGQEFNEKYITQPDGTIMKRTELSHGRHIQYKVDSLPSKGGKKLPVLKEEINFLPAGKVPLSYLHQIVDFFKRVMTDMGGDKVKTHGALEAMAHIVWNPEQDPTRYFVRIPTQRVSAASVTYEFDHLEEGDTVIVDIHSHNNMGAFFSGTDDRDDSRHTCYTGVVGKLGSGNYETCWRFNDLDSKKFKCGVDDIFEAETLACPDEWLEKVKKGGRGGTRPFWGAGNQFNQRNNAGLPARTNPSRSGNEHLRGIPSLRDQGLLGFEDEFDRPGIGANAIDLEELEKEAADALGMKGEGADFPGGGEGQVTLSDVLKDMVEQGQLRVEDIVSVKPRFVQQSVNGVEVWEDAYQTSVHPEDVVSLLTEDEVQEIAESEGLFMMYIENIDTYITSIDITPKSTSEELWEIFCSAEEEEWEDDLYDGIEEEELDAIIDAAAVDASKEDLMEYLKNGTSPIERLLLVGFLSRLPQFDKGDKNKSSKEEGESDVSVH